MKNLEKELRLLQEADLIDRFDGATLLFIHEQIKTPYEPLKRPFLYWNDKLKEFGINSPATQQQISNVFQPLGATMIFVAVDDGCEPINPDQES